MKAVNNLTKKFQNDFGKKTKEEKPKKSNGMMFNGGRLINQFNNIKGRSSIAMFSASSKKSAFKISSLASIEEKPTKISKPFSIKDLVKRNTKQLIGIAKLETNKMIRIEQGETQMKEQMKKQEEQKEPELKTNLNNVYKNQNWVKNYLKRMNKKVTSKMELNKMDEDMDLIKSKIEMTENNIKNDLLFFQDMLDQEEEEEKISKKTFGSKVNVSKYFSKEESIILEEKEEEYYTYEDCEDSMEDLRSIDFSKKANTAKESEKKDISIDLKNEKLLNSPKVESSTTLKKFNFNVENTTSMYIGKMNPKTEEKKKKSIQKTDQNSIEKTIKKSDELPTKPKVKKAKKIEKKILKTPLNLSAGNSMKFISKPIKSKKSLENQRKLIRESIRQSKIMKINTVTDFDLKQEDSSDSDSDTDSDDSDWAPNVNKEDLLEGSNRSSRPSRLDSDYFLHKKGDTHILRILHESQRMIDVMKDESKNGKQKITESEFEKFQKSQKIYFKESDLKGLTEEELDIRKRIKTSNRLIKHIDRKEPNLDEFSKKDITEMKLLIEEPFKYKSFDKLTENEKNERVELEVTYKKRILEKINKIISTYSGKKQEELVTKEMVNVVSGRTLHRWKNIQKGELTKILKIQRYFRFKIEERIGKKIMEMQKQYYQTRASIISPPK
jgi:hypothetical protein